jgi:outer membrane protein OmpA-like peptidoglycan-associated protein
VTFLSRWQRTAALITAVFAGPLSAQQQLQPRVLDLEQRVLDLEYRIVDLGGRVQDLNIKETDTEIRIEMAADVLFDFDKADIKMEAKPSLEKVAAVLAGYPRSHVSIEGHTDGKGMADYNQKLSQRRAASVEHWLKGKKELEGVRFSTRGYGATKPVAPNTKPDGSDDPEGRQKNRRVEIVVKKK